MMSETKIYIDFHNYGFTPNLSPDLSPFTIGRAAECDFTLDDPSLSRKHCTLTFEENKWWIEDHGSANGTYVNDEPILTKHRLKHGSKIFLGGVLGNYVNESDKLDEKQVKALLLKRSKPEATAQTAFQPKTPALLKVLVGLSIVMVSTAILMMIFGNSGSAAESTAPTPGKNTGTNLSQSATGQAVSEQAVFDRSALVTPNNQTIVNGQALILSNPTDAQVFINQEFVGKTPFPLSAPKTDSVSVMVKAPGFKPGYLRIDSHKLLEEGVNFDLEQAPGTIYIESTPSGASVFLKNQILGTTPLMLNDLPRNIYNFKISQYGYLSQMRQVDFRTGEAQRTSVQLTNQTAAIKINTRPAGCRIYIDGIYRGMSTASSADAPLHIAPFVLEKLSTGPHTVEVRYRGQKVVHKISKLNPRQLIDLEAFFWEPNLRIDLKNGRTIRGMQIASEDPEFIQFMTSPVKTHKIRKSLITTFKPMKTSMVKALSDDSDQ